MTALAAQVFATPAIDVHKAKTGGDRAPCVGAACDEPHDVSTLRTAVATAPSTAASMHDKSMAADFLALLDPNAQKFSFQFFGDGTDAYAEVVHGSLDDIWPKVQALNTAARRIGVFVTINQTDFRGRRSENIVRARSLFVDADDNLQIQRCRKAIRASGAEPTMVVRTSAGRAHFYWCCDDLARDAFPRLQSALIDKLGTDRAVKDLARVMRLPGTLHLKDAKTPTKVTLLIPSQARHWKVPELITALGLSAPSTDGQETTVGRTRYLGGNLALTPADAARLQRLFGPPTDDLSAGLETNIEEIRSAVSAISPSAISNEPDWMKLARGLAHEAQIYKDQSEEIWEILETVSRSAPGYDKAENRNRWLRYKEESLDREDPITIATVFDLAKKHGWQGWTPLITPPSAGGFGPTTSPTAGLKVSFSNIPHRRWLYGVDLIRGEFTLLAAPGGVGKSSLAIGMSVSLAVGDATLEEKIWDHELTALYLNGEDSGIEMQRRIWAFCLHHQIAEQDLARLLVAGVDDWRVQKTSLLRTDKGTSFLDQNGVEHLETLLQVHRPDLLVLDPLVAFCGGGNVNDNGVMALVMRSLKRLATEFDCAVLIIHHTKKGGDLSNAEAISGASAIVNLSRRALMTLPMTHDEAKQLSVLPSERFRYFKVVASKSNLAPPSNDPPWYELRSVELLNAEPPTYPSGDRVQAVARARFPTLSSPAATVEDLKIKRAIADVVDRGKVIGGQSYPYSPKTTGAKNQRALLDDAMAAVANATAPRPWLPSDLQAEVERSTNRMMADGWLVDEQITTGRFRRGRALRVAWPCTPWASAPGGTGSSEPAVVADKEDPPQGEEQDCGQLVNGAVND